MKHLLTNDECVYGTRKVPKKWKPCCSDFDRCTLACQYEVRIEWHGRGKWGMPVLDGGSSYVPIKFCPFCGVKL